MSCNGCTIGPQGKPHGCKSNGSCSNGGCNRLKVYDWLAGITVADTMGAPRFMEMKIGDVEFQGDGRKATFYYTADDRVDFRELIKIFAKEFHVKVEMHQIGARQEAGRIGGIGSCGRELCCSTWLTDFKAVGTAA